MDYTLYIHDARYSVPTLVVVTAACDLRAQELAGAWLARSPNHRQVEIWREDVRVGLLLRDPED